MHTSLSNYDPSLVAQFALPVVTVADAGAAPPVLVAAPVPPVAPLSTLPRGMLVDIVKAVPSSPSIERVSVKAQALATLRLLNREFHSVVKEALWHESLADVTRHVTRNTIFKWACSRPDLAEFEHAVRQVLTGSAHVGLDLRSLPTDAHRLTVLNVLQEKMDLQSLEVFAAPKDAPQVIAALVAVQKSHPAMSHFALDLSARSNDKLREADIESLAQLTNLTSLNIEANQIGDTGAAHLAALKNLTYLHIGDNRLSAVGAAAVARLTELTKLDISRNQLGDTGAVEVAGLIKLINLDIRRNQLGAASAANLAKLSNILYLNIGFNQLDDTSAAELAKFSRLALLIVRGNRISAAELQALRDALPNANIIA